MIYEWTGVLIILHFEKYNYRPILMWFKELNSLHGDFPEVRILPSLRYSKAPGISYVMRWYQC